MTHSIKVHKTYRYVAAICDLELLGKKFEEGNRVLDLPESFFKGEEVEEGELIATMVDLAKEDATFNLIGRKTVNAAIKAGLVTREGVKMVQGVPFALVLL